MEFNLDLMKSIESKTILLLKVKQRETMSKALSKYIAAFDYFDKTLLVLSAPSGSISIASLATAIGALGWITSTSPCLAFSVRKGIAPKLLKTMRRKKKNHNKTIFVATNK